MPKRSLKTFAFLGDDSSEPTAYGLGRAGWVTIPLDGDVPPESILREWIDESYCAIAPKTLAKLARSF